MGRACTVCQHAEREAIDRALVTRSASHRQLSARYGLSASAIDRHAFEHVPVRLVEAQDASDVAASDTLLSDLATLAASNDELLRIARTIVARAMTAGDLRVATGAINAAGGVLRAQLGQLELKQRMRESSEISERIAQLEELARQEDTMKGPTRWRVQ